MLPGSGRSKRKQSDSVGKIITRMMMTMKDPGTLSAMPNNNPNTPPPPVSVGSNSYPMNSGTDLSL